MHERHPVPMWPSAQGYVRRSTLDYRLQRERSKLLTSGVPRSKDPLVLLHPFALCSRVWAPLEPYLERYHDLVPISIPGHPGSDPLPVTYRHSISAALDLIEAKLDGLGIHRAHVVGNSLGGWLGIELARRGCRFRRWRAGIPREADHVFQSKPISRSIATGFETWSF